MMTGMKRLVVGDIHGCLHELLGLLDRAGLGPGDEVISLGDLVDRGPESAEVVDFVRRSSGWRVIKGNHEHKHLDIALGRIEPSLSQVLARRQFDLEAYAKALAFFEGLLLFIDLPEACLIHGCLEPGKLPAEQRPETLLGLMSAESYLHRNFPAPWYDLYEGEKPVVAGHHDYSKQGKPLVINDRVFLVDTGCCYGGALTGLILPEFRLVSVPSRRNHWAIAVQQSRAEWHNLNR